MIESFHYREPCQERPCSGPSPGNRFQAWVCRISCDTSGTFRYSGSLDASSCLPRWNRLQTPDPELSEILAELSRREPIFHRPELGTTRADFETMTAGRLLGSRSFRSSLYQNLHSRQPGRRYAAPHSDVWETMDFHCRRLARDVYLLTYTLVQDKRRRTRRSTIWQRTAEGSEDCSPIRGTIVQDA